jgi:PAS domain S-box-containing protein
MKGETKILLYFLGLGALLWAGDAAVESLFVSHESFLDALLLDVHPYEIYVRAAAFLACAAAGVLAGVLVRRERSAVAGRLESERRFRAFMKNFPGLAFLRDAEGRYLFVNEGWSKATGLPPEEVLGKTPELLFSPEKAEELREEDRRVLEGTAIHWERFLQRTGSGEAYYLASKFPVPGEEGRPAGVGGISLDVTSQVLAEQRLAQAEQRYRAILEGMEEGFCETDLQGILTFVNPAFCKMFGRTEGEILGHSYRDFMDEAQAEETYRLFHEVFLTGRPAAAANWEIVRKDGTRVAIEVAVSPIPLSPGRWSGFRGVLRDVTGRRAAEAERARARRLETVAKLSEGVAHEVRNPLFAIQVNLAALGRALAPEGSVQTHMDHVFAQMKRLDELVRGLLELGQAAQPEEWAQADLWDLVRSACVAAGDESPSLRERIVMAEQEGSAPVRVEGRRIVHAFAHLLRNADQASPAGGKIRIECAVKNGVCSVSISDEGPGIPAKVRETLFEPFVTTRTGHSGLGLALARHYIESHGGSVEAAANDPPPGATFTVRLPSAPSEPDGGGKES